MAVAGKSISRLQFRHFSIISDMKPLILILLAATYAAAQTPTIADIARQERARRAEGTATKVFTTADIKKPEPKAAEEAPPATTAPTSTGKPDAAGAPAAATQDPAREQATAPAAAVTPAPDPVQQWLAETDKLRSEIRETIDKEAVTQLEINSVLNRVNAPVSSVSEKDRALADLAIAQNRLAAVRDQLAKKRSELQARELQGPPKK
jgi:hypothetical protein